MANNDYPSAQQNSDNIAASANLAAMGGQPTASTRPPPKPTPSIIALCKRISNENNQHKPPEDCQQELKVSFFFDGTGNNLEADKPTQEMSNAAKLFLAHQEKNKSHNLYPFYIPGIGTYFEDISDPGGTTKGLAFGAFGQERIKWALNKFNEAVKSAELTAVNPRNRIAMVRVAAFGFSRGATLARAFAREIQALCRQVGTSWQLNAGAYPIRFYFLGLWDTVASVGLPMSANNMADSSSTAWVRNVSAMQARHGTLNAARFLAFGHPGADPAPGPADGHADWAHPLDVPVMVEKCVHMVAAHEIRNSFPLDSCRRSGSYPVNTEEMVYPGAHSDVGGGYRPGEGARSMKPGQMLSVLPLRAMHRMAWESGVPLYPISSLPHDYVVRAFAAEKSSEKEFARLTELWHHYMTKAGMGGMNLGRLVNSHMRLYYGWRFYKIRQNRAARAGQNGTKDETELKRLEAQWSQEEQALKKEMDPLKRKSDIAHTELSRAENRLSAAESHHRRYGTSGDPALRRNVEEARTTADAASDEYLRAKARHDTLPSSDGSLARNMQIYDDQLMADAESIRAALLAAPTMPVRPHYRNLLDAYEAEFIRGEGLRDEKIIEFFDTYVHDSLAGFANDATLPSDPRVIYVGDDVKSRHAQGSSSESNTETA